MKHKLIFIFFSLLPLLGFSQKPTIRDTNNLEQMIDEFLDYHILREIFQVRRLSNITEGMLVSDGGNLPLGDFANYFYQQTKIGIRIRSYVEKDHLWSNLNKKDYQQSQKEDYGLYLQIDVKLEPQELIESKGYRHKLTIEIKPSLLLEQTKQIPQDRYDAMNAFLTDSIGTEIIGPTRDRLNSAVIGALMILVGAADFPVYATLTPVKGFNAKDEIPNIALQNQYHSVVINNKQQILPWYSVKSNQSIDVDATIKKMLIDTVAKPIRIMGSNGFQKELKSTDTASRFSISGMPAGDYTVSANLLNKNFEVPLAGFDLAVYDKQDITIKLIPLGVNKTDVTGLSELLKNLYKQAVIECNTSVDEVFTTDAFKDKLEVGDNSFFSNYSSQMNDIIRDYKKDNPIDKKTYYIFVVPRFSQTAVQGYMPMKRQFGFVALQKTADFTSLILAHELGHGAFCLEHPEKEFGVTLHFNLMSKVMDFPSGGFRQDKLAKYQWDQAHDPPGGMFLFQEEEDVMATGDFFKGIQFWEVADYIYKGQTSSIYATHSVTPTEDIIVGEYQLQPHYNKDFDGKNKLSFYNAVREVNGQHRFEYLIGPESFNLFKEKINIYTSAANLFYIHGPPSESELKTIVGLQSRDVTTSLSGLANMWAESLTDVEWWLNLGFCVLAPQANFGKLTQAGKTAVEGFKNIAGKSIGKGLQSIGSLGYKAKVVASEIILYTNLNFEIARFNTKGVMRPMNWMQAGSNIKVLSTFDDVVYAENAAYSTTKTATLELVQESSGKVGWRIKQLVNNVFFQFNSETGILTKETVDFNLLQKAKQWQGKGAYIGIDEWIVVEIPKGTKVYGGLPGQSEFYTTIKDVESISGYKALLWNRLQVKPHPIEGYRSKLGEYVVRQDVKVVISKAKANPQFGDGGGWQIFIENYTDMLEFSKEIILK